MENLKVGIEAEAIGEQAFAGQSMFQARRGVDLPQTLARPLDGGTLLWLSLGLRQDPGPGIVSGAEQQGGGPCAG